MILLFGLFKTDIENKRDDYLKLYNELEDLKSKHDQLIGDIESYYSSYQTQIPNLDEKAIPNKDFVLARERLDQDLETYLDQEKDYRTNLVHASDQAYDKYIYYKNKAMEED